MSIKHKKLGAALLCVVAIGIAVATTAGATSQTTPGVTGTKVTIGGTFPLSEGPTTGGASLYKTITAAEQAYFAYVNTHGKVHGRTIQDIVLNDHYTPSETLPLVKQLVESDHVFAIVGSLGTDPGLATWNYLNNNGVPQVLLASGDSYWGICTKTGSAFHPVPNVCTKPKPWTMGWQPDYPGEAKLYAKYILAHQVAPHAKIGILYQAGAHGYGENYLNAFVAALGTHKSYVVKAESYAVGENTSQIIGHIGQIKASGANALVIFATPGASIGSLIGLQALHWNHGTGGSIPGPAGGTFLNNVSANRVFMLTAQQNGAKTNGVISTTYIKSKTTFHDSAMALGKAIIYGTGNASLKHQWDIGDSNLVYGLAVAWTFVDALKHAGSNLTRASFMNAIRNLNESGATKNPFVYPGMAVKTCSPCASAVRTFPMEQLIMEKWAGQTSGPGGDWGTFGSVLNSGH